MAMSQIDTAAANLGKFLQIVYSNGIRNQISEDHRDWEMVSKQKVSDEAARSVNFLVQTTYGAPAVQWAKQGTGQASFPSSKQVATQEASAGFNQLYSTVEIEYDLWQRAMGAPHKYAEPLANEIKSKGIIQKRLLSAAFHLDGGGSLGTVASATTITATTPDTGTVTFSNLGARYCEYGDFIQPTVLASGADTALSNGAAYYRVDDKDRSSNTITVSAFTAAGVQVDADPAADVTTTDYFRRYGTTGVNQTFGASEVNDLTEMMPGIESLGANDGRVLHGLTQSGALGGTQYDASAQPVDISHLQAGLDKLKTIVGDGAYKYKQVLTAPETLSAFIASNETDRRLVSNTDNKRGSKGFGYIHNNDTLEFATTEFTRADRMWVIPEGSKESGVLELHGKDFQEVKAGAQGEFLKTDGLGNYSPSIQKFMMGYMTLICKRPSAILSVRNFTV